MFSPGRRKRKSRFQDAKDFYVWFLRVSAKFDPFHRIFELAVALFILGIYAMLFIALFFKR